MQVQGKKYGALGGAEELPTSGAEDCGVCMCWHILLTFSWTLLFPQKVIELYVKGREKMKGRAMENLLRGRRCQR